MAPRPCPACGVDSTTVDFCNSCGAAFDRPTLPASAVSGTAQTAQTAQVDTVAPAPAVAPGEACPCCGMVRNPDDGFCEECGFDFTTGQMPAASLAASGPASGRAVGWTALIEADAAHFDRNQAECARAFIFPAGLGARTVPLRGDEVVIGRRDETDGFFPDIDLSEPVLDPGVSRRHAVLRRQGDESWGLMDKGSTNGTLLNAAPVRAGALVDVHDGDRIHLGLFTLITVRQSSEDTNR